MCDRVIETKIQQANKVTFQLSPILEHPAIKMGIKRNIINAVFIPTLCYQCQTWTLNKDQVRKIHTCEMRCLRKALNKTRRDHVRNKEIRKTVGTTPVINFIENQRLTIYTRVLVDPRISRSVLFGGKIVSTIDDPRISRIQFSSNPSR